LHYLADQGGCAFWRLIWPGNEMMSHNKAVVMSLYQMVTDPNFYRTIDVVRLQRQCTGPQVEMIKHLRNISNSLKASGQKGFKIVYECDDLTIKQDIPNFNACKIAFEDPQIEKNVKEILEMVDEFTVPSKFMKKRYSEYFNYNKISVIPNYAPKSWLDRGYNLYQKVSQYRKNKKKPRIMYAGSSTHFDILNKMGGFDDFTHVVDYIIDDIKNKKQYQWIFVGGFPAKLKPYIDDKTIEYHNWTTVTQYPETLREANAQVMIAPLADNNFNKAKANIKLTEGGSLGMPVVAQNLDCYHGYKYLFNTGEEMMKQIKQILSSEATYQNAVEYARGYAEKYWLEDHLHEWELVYNTEYGSEERTKNEVFTTNNPNQFDK
jgi:hypothetical protein